jgi:hypothetical protein
MMKKLLIALAFMASLATPRVFAAFEDTGTGARGTALGSNYVVMGDDILSLMYNPATLARVDQKQITTEYSKLYAGLSDGSNLSQYYFGYGQPIEYGGTVSIGVKQFSLQGLYQERTISIGYGEWLTDKIAIGGALKQLYHSFGAPNMIVDNSGNQQAGTPTFFAKNGNSNTAYSADLGTYYKMSDVNAIGFSVQDINEPNIALDPADHEIVPKTVRLSVAHEADRHLTLGGGIERRKNLASTTDTVWTGSAEKWWTLSEGDQVSVRGSLALGSREYQQGVLGAGYRFPSFQLDYAFVFNLTGLTPGATMGTHRFSLTYRFGPKGLKIHQKALPRRRHARVHRGEDEWTKPPLPRHADIQITPEDEGESYAPYKVQDIDIGVVFDSDYDGVPDDDDQCPNTAFGAHVDPRGCALEQLDHHGNPLPKKVHVEFLPLDIPLEEIGQ